MSDEPPFDFFPPQPPDQGPVGKPPSEYLAVLRAVSGSATPPIESFYSGLNQPLDRHAVARICRDGRVHVLEAFAAAMAWGGMRPSNFRLAIGSQGLAPLLENLRKSRKSLQDDYVMTLKACETIGGLRISFWSKLLYFFRRAGDAPILDQRTAKSINVIFPNSIRMKGNFPAPDLSVEEYETYIDLLKQLCKRLREDWSAIDMETALFDHPKGKWRKWVRSQYPAKAAPRQKAEDQRGEILDGVKKLHQARAKAGMPLPPGIFLRSKSDPNRLRIGGEGASDILWWYRVGKLSAAVGVLFAPKAAHLLAALLAANDQGKWFGPAKLEENGLVISTGFVCKNETPGLTASHMVDAMSALYANVHALARIAGIRHPKL